MTTARPVSSRAAASILQAFFFEALEAVRTGARLERAAAEGGRAGLLDARADADDLLFAFDGAGAGDDAEVAAADGEAAGADDGRLRLGFEAGDFVRREDGQHFIDAGAAFEHADAAASRSSPIAAMTVRSVPRSTVGFRPSDSTCLIMCSMSSSLASRRMTTIIGRLHSGSDGAMVSDSVVVVVEWIQNPATDH